MNQLYLLIKKSQEGNQSALEKLLQMFHPLLCSKSKLLRRDHVTYDDSYNDLQLAFIELLMKKINLSNIQKDDKYIISYIQKSMYHVYIDLSKKQGKSKLLPFSAIMGDEEDFDDVLNRYISSTDMLPLFEYDEIFKSLTVYEAEIIKLFYFEEKSVKNIAKIYDVSSPAISQTKKSALLKLKIVLSEI